MSTQHEHNCDKLPIGETIHYDSRRKQWAPYYNGVEQDIDCIFCHRCGMELPKTLFHVKVAEVWWQTYEVFSKDQNEAILKVDTMSNDITVLEGPEYSRRMEKASWNVSEVP